MNRQCRICLDTENPTTMIAPCQCRGSAEFIHKTCLEEYFRHFPDGVCGVCRTKMYHHKHLEYVTGLHVLFCLWFLYLLCATTVALRVKFLYLAGLILLFFYLRSTRVFHPSLFLVFFLSFLTLVVEPQYLLKLVMSIGLATAIVTIGYYIPPHYMFILYAISLLVVYMTTIAIYVITTSDQYMASFFVGFASMIWFSFIKLRPPFDAIN